MAADALSRMFFMAWSEPQAHFIEELKQEISSNEELQKIVQACSHNAETVPYYSVKQNLLYWKNRLVIPEGSKLIQQILKEYHSSPIRGHAGVARTLARISPQFYWPGLKNDVREFVQHCVILPASQSQ